MNGTVFAVVVFCGAGSIALYLQEPTAREHLALLNGGGCGDKCRRLHTLVEWQSLP